MRHLSDNQLEKLAISPEWAARRLLGTVTKTTDALQEIPAPTRLRDALDANTQERIQNLWWNRITNKRHRLLDSLNSRSNPRTVSEFVEAVNTGNEIDKWTALSASLIPERPKRQPNLLNIKSKLEDFLRRNP